ncbi:3',5'-cyclic nucleotide phosphodiesterase, putative [Plasmodium berghei]|uniref:Phosphodiesterase n=2 Tax=Plasmodium berghei TaxID=5821 RepID=A0A509ASJ0_PLABA|nr:3',5'-cyclic nucleotide phosphodiesterase beta, putative [Plasmodium berghei ANKA]CXJ15878.1 3',5'-cyclic nucleotide phosphodiesterase, putative [Plasmodium berghei]SCM26277.1 3',5'-cyclic nucleotide phosphodiesterase, putative [Plasmodium berghei]SCN28369.1 3',5'-cyclic nucleotide phosphodiesterase, putative [Plasmodium berghei]SCO64123.1 3',5'-cyclic nucleotide phosphodiesterase, putative [Plasmodium berghei]VUC58257.1 3',5'-cyclic nucleotide phosphodiesterase beta, putative [Plasmodium b|eukprot:XP_034424020.1 3',5'-cyclic nucleotide phosphodiesterase beta, putative [Plasmodium berghei ANKA]
MENTDTFKVNDKKSTINNEECKKGENRYSLTNKNRVISNKKGFIENMLNDNNENKIKNTENSNNNEKKITHKPSDLNRSEEINNGTIKKNSNLKKSSNANNKKYKKITLNNDIIDLKEYTPIKKNDSDIFQDDKPIDTYYSTEMNYNNENDKKLRNSSINWSSDDSYSVSSDSSYSNANNIKINNKENNTKISEYNCENITKGTVKDDNQFRHILIDIKNNNDDNNITRETIINNLDKKNGSNTFLYKPHKSLTLVDNLEKKNGAYTQFEDSGEDGQELCKLKKGNTYENNNRFFNMLRTNVYMSINKTIDENINTNDKDNKNRNRTNYNFNSLSSQFYENIKESNDSIKRYNETKTGKNKGLINIFEIFFYKIWKRSIIINKDICASNSKYETNTYKSSITSHYLKCNNENELISQLPLKFKDDTIESLYVLNLNNWISLKMIIIGIIMLILGIYIWALCIWSFRLDVWKHDSYIILLFNTLMSLNSIIFIFFIIVGFTELSKYAEFISYALFTAMVSIWGIWNIVTSLSLNNNFAIKETSYIFSSVETVYSLTYIYCFLPLVIMDVFFTSRTKYNWFIHVIFLVLNSISIITLRTRNPNLMPFVYVVFRIAVFVILSLFLYMGCYASEFQMRYFFYNILIIGCKLDKTELGINKNNKNNNKKFSSAIEDLILMIKECSKVMVDLENEPDINFNVHRKTSYCVNILERCLSTLTKTDNLYNVDYEFFDKLESKKFVEAYVSKEGSNFNSEQCSLDYKINTSLSYKNLICIDKVDMDKNHIKNFLKNINIPHVTNMIQLIDKNILSEWDFNCLKYFKKEKYPFFDINLSLMCTIEHNIPMNLIINFLAFVEKQYNNVPYHNTMHATMVTHKFFCLTKKLGIFDHIDYKIKLVMFISGICHDIGHPGYNNLFFINSFHPLSIIYNDISVLENYHASITFKILQLSQCNILKSFSEKEFRLIRLYIIELILSTDMKHHYEIISKFRIRRENEKFDYIKDDDDLLALMKMIIKSADISHGAVKWREHYKWCQRVLCEFYFQGDEELNNKMPISPLCDREKHNEVGQSQIAFLKFVVMPLFEEIAYIDNTQFVKNYCLKRLNRNRYMWDKFIKEEKEIKVFDPSKKSKKEKEDLKKVDKNQINNRKKSYIDLTLFFIKNISD